MFRRLLQNGLDVVIQESRFSKMFALQCWVGVGSIHEEPQEAGICHCIEHMLFKGTRNFGVGELSKRIEFLGGEMNAYTSFEHTVFYLTMPAQHAREAIDILAEAIFYSSFDAEELEREKEVILEERKRGEDNPSHALGRKIFESIYKGTKAAGPIIGTEETIRGYTREMILNFYKKWYRASNMKLVAVGNIEADQIFQQIEMVFGEGSRSEIPRAPQIQVQPRHEIDIHVLQGNFEQARLEIAFSIPGILNDDVLALDVAAFALGSGEASRLHQRVRDKNQLTSSVGCSIYTPKFGGLFEISAMPHDDNYLECVSAIGREFGLLKYAEPVTQSELDRARANVRADRIYSEETVAGQARALGNSLQMPHELLTDLIHEAKINRLTTRDIAQATRKWLDEKRCTIACILPPNQQISVDQVRAAFLKGVESSQPETLSRQKVQEERAGVFRYQLTPQITLLYRQQDHVDLMNVCAVRSGGLRSESAENLGAHSMLSNLVGMATGSYTYEEMLEKTEGIGAILAGFSGKDSFGLKLQCLTEQFGSLLPLLAESLLDPKIPEAQLKSAKMEVFDDIRYERDQPASIAMREFFRQVYRNHPYQYPAWGVEECVESFSSDYLTRFHHLQRENSHWIISGVGRLTFDVYLEQMTKYFAPMCRSILMPRDLAQNLPATCAQQRIHITKEKEQVHLVAGTLGLAWNNPQRYALDVLSSVLGGSGGRLFLRLRDEQSLAYSVSPLHSYGCHRGIFGVYMACSPAKLEIALQGVKQVFSDICHGNLNDFDVARARNYLIGSHESDMQRGDAQAMNMALMELYGLGYDDFDRYATELSRVRLGDVIAVAQQILVSQEQVVVTVGPEPVADV